MAVEVLHNLRITIFQPFRMATVGRGLALVLIAGRLVDLWSRGGWFHRTRAVLIGVALAGDWMFVVVTLAELGATLAERAGDRLSRLVYGGLLAWGLFFLSRHDTESGHWPLLLVLAGQPVRACPRSGIGGLVAAPFGIWSRPRPALVLAAGLDRADTGAAGRNSWRGLRRWHHSPLVRGLIARCRFAAVPIDDIERLAVWCRDHTPIDARFIGPPGPKTFRLWSRRSLAFSRSGSPYHAAGLADWFARFQDHVDLHVPPAEFVRAYVAGRHRLEARYDAIGDQELAALAMRQEADHVIALTARLWSEWPAGAIAHRGTLRGLPGHLAEAESLAADQRQR